MRSTPSTRPRGARARLAAGLGAAALLAVPAAAAAQTDTDEAGTTEVGTAEVVVVHGVPDLVVDVLIDGEVAIEAMEFADAPVVTTLPEGDVGIVVAATGTTDPVLSLDATLTSGTSVTVAAHLDALGAPKLAAYENRTTTAGIQPFHLADFGAVDVLAGTEVLLAGVLDGQTARIDLPDGATVADVGVRASGTSGIAIDLGTLTVASDELLLVYAIGPDTGETLPTIVTARVDAVAVGDIGAGEAGLVAAGALPAGNAGLMALGLVLVLAPVAVRRR